MNLTYRKDIDGLRAIAVLGVLVFHAFPNFLPGGFVGVDVFFVISGFLITTSINQDLKQNNFSVWGFYSRRIKRIFPSLLAMLLVVWLSGVAVLMPHELKELGVSLISSAYFGNNFLLYSQAGYFDTQADQKPLLHLWSLSVEEQFYVVWPLMLWIAAKWFLRGRIFIVFLLLSSFLPCLLLTENNPIAASFLPFFRAWELIFGALLASYRVECLRLVKRILGSTFWLSSLGLVLVVVAYGFVTGDQPYPGWRALLPVTGACLVVLAESNSWFSRKVLSVKPLVAIGLISYPLYLWHWPLFSFARILYGELSVSLLIGLMLASFGFAWASYLYLEQPVRFSGWSKSHAILVPISGLVLLITVGALGNFTRIHDGFPSRVPSSDWQALNWTAEQIGDGKCKSELDVAGIYCLKSGSQPPSVALIGDSHANHFFSGLAFKLDEQGKSLVLLGGPLGADDSDLWHNVEVLLRSENIKNVFIAYHASRIREKFNPFDNDIERIVDLMLNSGKQVIFIIDSPEFSFDPRLCTERPQAANWLGAGKSRLDQCSESYKSVLIRRGAYDAYVAKLVARYPSMHFLDMTSPFCNDAQCYAFVDNKLLYRDPHHLTANGSMHAFRSISLDWLGP